MVTFTLDAATTIQLVLTVFMPILVGFITTRLTSGSVKAWLLAGASLVTSLLVAAYNAVVNGVAFDVGIALLAAIPAFAISVATYYGLWKPTGVAEKAQSVLITDKDTKK